MAAWRGSRFEIQGVLREVCDRVLGDKTVSLEKRVQRAEALMMVGKIFAGAERDPDDEVGEGVFESLVAEAARDKQKDKEKRKSETGKKSGGFFSGSAFSTSSNGNNNGNKDANPAGASSPSPSSASVADRRAAEDA